MNNNPADPVALTLDVLGGTAPLDQTIDVSVAKHRAARGAGATLIAQSIKFVMKFGSTAVLGRLLDPAAFGIVAMVAPILAFVSTLNDLGFAQAVVQRRDITAVQVSTLFWMNLAVSAVLAAMLMAAAPAIGWLYREPKTIGITVVMAAMIVVGTAGLVPTALLNRRLDFIPIVGIDLLSQAVNVTLAVLLAWFGYDYWSLVVAQVAASFVGLIGVLIAARWRPFGPRRRAPVGPLVKFGLNLTGVNLITYFSISADNMIVGYTSGKVQLGLYDRSYALVFQPLGQLAAPLGRVAVPLLSRLIDDGDRFRAAYLTMLRLAMLFTVPAMICCTLFAGPVIVLLLGPKWMEAAPVFAWISFGGIFSAAFSSISWVFTADGRARQQLRASMLAAGVNIVAFLIGIRWGAVGVAAAGAISFGAIQLPLMIVSVTRAGHVRISDFARALWPFAIAGGVTWLAVGLVHVGPTPYAVLIPFLIAYPAFAVTLALLPGGRDLFASIIGIKRWLSPPQANTDRCAGHV